MRKVAIPIFLRQWQQPFLNRWKRFWMGWAGLGRDGRWAMRLAAWGTAPHKGRIELARLSPRGYIAPTAEICHRDLWIGKHVFIGDRVVFYQEPNGGPIRLGDRVAFLRDTIVETGFGGGLTVGAESFIHPRCQINAHVGSVNIGSGVMIAANCAFYPHNHGMQPDRPIRRQPLECRGDITVGDEAWLGTGVTLLGGAQIGSGAVIGAGSVVTTRIPDNAIAVGSPAKVVKYRSQISSPTAES